jgi:hypothetical protein
MRKVLLNDSRPEPSAGRGALAMVGYCWLPCISCFAHQLRAQWLAGFAEIYCLLLTEVVFTPQSNSGSTGEGAGGVSTHSKFSSDVLLLILHLAGGFCKMRSRDVGFLEGGR